MNFLVKCRICAFITKHTVVLWPKKAQKKRSEDYKTFSETIFLKSITFNPKNMLILTDETILLLSLKRLTLEGKQLIHELITIPRI